MTPPARFKYPRTPHLAGSGGKTRDDVDATYDFAGVAVVVTEKLDGESATIYSDGFTHARSLDSGPHPSRDWQRAYAATVGPQLPPGWRICGENLFARHSVGYSDLESYYYGFGIWDDQNRCLDWDETLVWFDLLGVTPVPVLYEGLFDPAAIHALWLARLGPEVSEGWVVRTRAGFPYAEASDRMAKMVRVGHVQTGSHWMYAEVIANGLRATT